MVGTEGEEGRLSLVVDAMDGSMAPLEIGGGGDEGGKKRTKKVWNSGSS